LSILLEFQKLENYIRQLKPVEISQWFKCCGIRYSQESKKYIEQV
jgi:hypothetical protein